MHNGVVPYESTELQGLASKELRQPCMWDGGHTQVCADLYQLGNALRVVRVRSMHPLVRCKRLQP